MRRRLASDKRMSYQPSYHYLPPMGPHWLTPFYDAGCALVGLGGNFKEQVLLSVPVNDGETIVDVGCATGVLLELAKKQYPHSRVIGIDPDAGALAIARKRLARTGLEAELHQAFAESLPLPDTSVDACFSSLAFHHMPDDVKRKALEEMKRVLKPGGRIVIADFGPTKGRWLRRLLFFEKVECLKGNLEGIIPRYLNEVGFKKLTVTGKRFPGVVIFTAKKLNLRIRGRRFDGNHSIKFMQCAKCNGSATTYKCAICGDEAKTHDANHTHGTPPSDRHCMPKCDGCSKAEVFCSCKS